VTSSGRLTLSYKGKSVATLKPGLYTVAVTDRSTAYGFMLATAGHRPVLVTGAAFTGTRSVSINLTPGTWRFMPRLGATSYTIAVT
jgi:hypothetical protein